MACIWKKHKPRQFSYQITASNSTLDHGSHRHYDVFLSFRGPDSRHTVADVFYSTLTRAGFSVFLDDEDMRKGKSIGRELLEAITNSRIYIIIFSKGYASSKWCLWELAEIKKCQESSGSKTEKVILPVFNEVDVKDVKLKSEVYTKALKKHRRCLGEAMVKSWEDALRDTAQIKGWILKDHGLTELTNLIQKEVSSIINKSESALVVPDYLFGIHDWIKDIMLLLDEESPYVRFIVLHGIGGSGKTTLAYCAYKILSSHFPSCCILSNIQQSSSDGDMVKLQEKLLSDTLNHKFIKVSDISDGINMISTKLRGKKVLLILDDVSGRDQLQNLAEKPEWFGPKSRVIITATDIGFFPHNESYFFYEMKPLTHGHALQLLYRRAFESDSPLPGYYDIATKIVDTTGGLPLAIDLIGSSLFNQSVETWKFRLEKLKEAPHENVQKKLMISYQALAYEQKQIFLDTACFFHDENQMDPFYFWEACNLHPKSGIEILTCRGLIKVNEKLWMHGQLRDFGRAVAQPQSHDLISQILREPSRLWSSKVALAVVKERKVVESIVALELGNVGPNCNFVHDQFAGSTNIRFLQLQGGNFEGDFKNLFQQLRWLSWFNCPLKIQAINLGFEKLAVLKLSGSQITDDWCGFDQIMVAKQLKVLYLIDCTCLVKTPKFSKWLELERLILKHCLQLEKIDESITELKNLEYLEISDGSRSFEGCWHHFRENSQLIPPQPQLLPDSMDNLKSLTVLKINNAGLTQLHSSISELVKLAHLHLWCPQLEILPHSIGNLRLLVELDISFSGIKVLPDSIGNLNGLQILRMESSAIFCLPESIGRLESLIELHMSQTDIAVLPETIGKLKKLKVIFLNFSALRELPKALGNLDNLVELHASGCVNMDGELPEEIAKLSSLKILNLKDTKIRRVPTAISLL